MVALKQLLDHYIIPSRLRKQERRGGIETQDPGLEALKDLNGSRNAVVALKPVYWALIGAMALEKQERRGGIETELFPFLPVCPIIEAGTPWWH